MKTGGDSTSGTTLAVGGPDCSPTPQNTSASTAEDTATTITLSATDVDSSSLTFTLGTPSNGTLSPATTPKCTIVSGQTTCTTTTIYTPKADYNGADSLTFKASDGRYTSPTASVSISITPVNDLPS